MGKRLAVFLGYALGIWPALMLSLCLELPAHADQAAPVPTATPTLALQIRAGFDGYYKAGGWLPVSALARNDGPPLNGRLTLATDTVNDKVGSYSAAAVLPTHSQKQLFFTAPAPSADRSRNITLTDAGRTVLTQTLAVSALSPQDYLYGVIAPNGSAVNVLRGSRQFGGTVSVAQITLADIPSTGPALNDVDALVLDDTPTATLSAAQRRTLLAWVSSGGQLVLGGGASAAQTLSGFADLAPVALSGAVVLDVGAALAPWSRSGTADNAPVAIGRPAAGSIVRLRAGNVPLVVDRPFGDGWITFLAMSAQTPTLQNAPGGVAVWEHILTGSRHGLDSVQATPQPGTFAQSSAVYSLPQTALPSGQLLAWLIFGYILVVGPVNYLLMRRLDRRELLWLTIPVVSMLFAGGAYLLARQLKGSDILVNTVTIARHSPGPAATSATTVDGAVGIFSPGRSSYTIQIGGGLAVTALDPTFNTTSRSNSQLTVVSEGSATLLPEVHVEKWSMQAFAVRGTVGETGDLLAPSPVEASLTITGSTVTGSIRNSGNQALQDVILAIGNDNATLSDLLPGEQRDVRLVLSGSVAPVSPPARPILTSSGTPLNGDPGRQAVLEGALMNGERGKGTAGTADGPELYAFSADAPFSVEVQGQHIRQHHLTLHILPVPIMLPTGNTTLPYGFAQREVLQNSGVSAQYGGPGLPLGSTAVFQFRLPANAVGRIWSALHIRLGLTNYGRPYPTIAAANPAVALYNWNSGTWDREATFAAGINTVQQATRYVDPRGLVRVQISGSNGQQQLQTLDISLDGAPQ